MDDDGEPAFPTFESFESDATRTPGIQHLGMTLRDWFAGMIASGTLSNPNVKKVSNTDFAKSCYGMADAMLEAREVDDDG